jgi:hypothetical protein
MLCCLGQCAVELGAAFSDILDKDMPIVISNREHLVGTALLVQGHGNICQTPLCDAAMSINDGSPMGEAEREHMLHQLFARYGHEIEFVDGVFPALTEKLPAVVAES